MEELFLGKCAVLTGTMLLDGYSGGFISLGLWKIQETI
jgi:hypothetical protein